MKSRKGKPLNRTILLLMVVLLPALASAQSSRTSTYKSVACGFRVLLPHNLLLLKPAGTDPCTFPIRSRLQSQTVGTLSVARVSFEKAAEELGFYRDGEQWMVTGENTAQANLIVSPNGHQLTGQVATRLYRKNGYAGLGDETRVVIGKATQSAMISVSLDSDDADLLHLLRSFEFLPE